MKNERADRAGERVLSGLGVSPGLALGTAHVSDLAQLTVPEYAVGPDDIAAEIERLEAAIEVARRQLNKLKAKSAALQGPASDEVGFLLDAHLAMLGQSRLVRGALVRIREHSVNAEAAVRLEVDAIAESFALIDDAYLAARVEDVRVVGGRLLRNLTKTPFASIGMLGKDTILLAEELSPADTALLDPTRVLGFATALGGAEGHTAIMARALGIPAVLGCTGLLEGAAEGDMVIINGSAGTVTINPSPETLEHYQAEHLLLAQERHRLQQIARLPAVTRDGVAVTLQANLELPRDLAQAVEAGAEGIGLVRTEFLFMNRDEPPSEEEQAESLLTLLRGMPGREVTIRTLDIGGDKLSYALRGISAESPNPALGLRAIRLSLTHRTILEAQISAILRISGEGQVRILLPMISSLTEVRQTREIMLACAERLRAQGIRLPGRLPPLGIMIEIPAAALAADAFAAETDFFAIGTNDLTQYTLAIDRSDEQVAHLYNPLHPSVLRLIEMAAAAATRAGIPVSVCGEMAGDPRYTSLLLGLGIRTLSMAPANLPRVKDRLRGVTVASAVTLAKTVLAERDESRIAALLEGI